MHSSLVACGPGLTHSHGSLVLQVACSAVLAYRVAKFKDCPEAAASLLQVRPGSTRDVVDLRSSSVPLSCPGAQGTPASGEGKYAVALELNIQIRTKYPRVI